MRDAQERLQRQARVLANQAGPQWNNQAVVSQWVGLSARQGQVQVLVFSPTIVIWVEGQGVPGVNKGTPPPELIRQTLSGSPQQGRFWVATDPQYPW